MRVGFERGEILIFRSSENTEALFGVSSINPFMQRIIGANLNEEIITFSIFSSKKTLFKKATKLF